MNPIICLDFDGVIHGYQSGWKGATVIPDPPVPGALEFIVRSLDHFRVAIFSSRSHQWGGKRAMRGWLNRQLINIERDCGHTPEWWRDRVYRSAFADPWPDEVRYAAWLVVKQIEWPWFKPAAKVTLDDRALTFTGQWPAIADLMAFQPWNKRTA